MSDFDRNLAARTGYRADQVAIDAGLRAHMIRLYNYMASGVALTGLVAWLTYSAAVITGDPWRGVALNWPTKPPAVPAAGISAPSSAARGAAGPVLFDERNAARFERGLNFPSRPVLVDERESGHIGNPPDLRHAQLATPSL